MTEHHGTEHHGTEHHGTERFGADYWRAHWADADAGGPPPHPALDTELAGLAPGTALDAGSGAGAEAAWLSAHGWNVTAVDIATAAPPHLDSAIRWVEADLTVWEPPHPYDLVTTFYAHPTIGQLAFYERIARWVAPGGTLLIVGHDQADGHGHEHEHGHEHPHPADATADLSGIRTVLAPDAWTIETAERRTRTLADPRGRAVALRDVVVRARRTGAA